VQAHSCLAERGLRRIAFMGDSMTRYLVIDFSHYIGTGFHVEDSSAKLANYLNRVRCIFHQHNNTNNSYLCISDVCRCFALEKVIIRIFLCIIWETPFPP
jgi:hypothetical protein